MKFSFFLVTMPSRIFKLLIFYFLMFPFFLLRFIFSHKTDVVISRLDKFLITVIGEIWIFGKNKIDLRRVYEVQRVQIAKEVTNSKLLFFLPGQWYTLSPLESALLVLMGPPRSTTRQKILLIPYAFYVLLFDESRDHLKANHGIGCALALSRVFEGIPKISRFYYFRAVKILRANSNYFFYDEGSTNYHIFVTSLFRNYFYLRQSIPTWFRGYEKLSEQLLISRDFFYFGDDDRSQWLFDYRHRNARRGKIGISKLIKDYKFKRSILDRYFKIYEKDKVVLLVCTRGSLWGHAHYMVGSIMYFINDRPVIIFQKNSFYTLNHITRQRDRLFSCNSPVASPIQASLSLAFFKQMPKELVSIIDYDDEGNQVSISGHGWRRVIDFGCDTLKVVDSAKDHNSLSSTHPFEDNAYVDYQICSYV